MSRGDVLFYRGNGSLVSRLIAWRTHGEYVHCEIDLGDGTAVGALAVGVTQHQLIPTTDVYTPPAGDAATDYAQHWLSGQVQRRAGYAWVDIYDAGLPSWWPVLMQQQGAYDCSHLVCEYLLRLGVPLGALADAPERVSPNDLWRALLSVQKAA